AITGRSVAVQGRIDLALLPRPTVTLARATLSGGTAAPDSHVLVVDRLDLRLKALPLLGGQFEVEEVRLVRPVVEVPELKRPGDATAALASAGGGFVLPLAGAGPSRLSVVDGRAVLSGSQEASGQREIEAINLDLSAAGPGGPYALAGDFVIAGQPFAFSAQLGQIATEAWITLQLVVTAGASRDEAARLSFHGLTWSNPAAPRLRGELSVTGSDARVGLAALGRALGDELTALPKWLAARYRLSGRLEFSDRTAALDDLRLTIADTEAAGRLRLGLGPKPAIDLRLGLGQLTAPEAWPLGSNGSGGLAALATLSTRIEGSIDLSVQALAYRGATVRRLRISLALDGAGKLTVEQARATLPGQTTVGFAGGLAGHGEAAALRGALTVVTSDLRAVLGWLGLAPVAVAEGRLRSMSLASQLAVDAGTLRFSDAELRVDASRAVGTLTLSIGPRPQVVSALALDRLDLDAYWPDGDAGRVIAGGLEAFGEVDAAIEARIERLTWHGLRLQDIALNGRSIAGRFTLDELSLRDANEGEARLAGEFDLGNDTFDLSAELATARPAQLLRRLGLMPPPMLARLTGVQVTGAARGDLDDFHLELEGESEGARLGLAGRIDRANGDPTYDLAVDASHPDYPQLLDRLGVPRSPAEDGPHPFTMTGKLSGDLSAAAAVVGSARLGAMSLTGRVDWQRGPPRPKLSVRLSAGEPSLQALVDVAAVAGLSPDLSLLGRPRPGDWSAQPLALHGFGELEAEFELSGKGGVAGPGFEVLARLEQGRLLVDQLAAALWDGRLEAQASFDLARPLPFLALALDLRAIDPEGLAAWLDLPPVVAGPVDLYVEATTAGNNPHDLIRGLIGDAKVTLPDGGLSGDALAALRLRPDATLADGSSAAENRAAGAVPIADFASSFTIRRGIATIREVPFVLDGAEARLLGTIDLLLWAADLTLSLDNGGAEGEAVGLRLVGPLDQPQILLLTPAEPMPAQAP
ncbi:MAG TPA: AsmA-like C-terminal region-containing protein, partial [Geminicoccaceae bacterium]|nr:AsmA-like C-terminal region-containing protein [Geminicoccaceae bacterium]